MNIHEYQQALMIYLASLIEFCADARSEIVLEPVAIEIGLISRFYHDYKVPFLAHMALPGIQREETLKKLKGEVDALYYQIYELAAIFTKHQILQKRQLIKHLGPWTL